MAKTSRQTAIFGTEDWKKIYKTYQEADFQSYNFETIRKTFVDYLRQHHPETFNDFTENSEYIALLNLMAFMGQALSFRNDVNTRENFLDTAERRDSVNNLSNLVGYTTKRNEAASGYLKVLAVATTENITDYNRNNLSNIKIRWNDKTNDDWQDQFTSIINAALVDSQRVGQPGRSASIIGVKTDEYQLNLISGYLPVVPFSSTVDGVAMDFEIVNGTSVNSDSIYEPAPRANSPINMLYRNDNQGYASPNTGYFFFFKQGQLQTQDFTLKDRIANRSVDITISGVNNSDVWVYQRDTATNKLTEKWTPVESIYSSSASQRNAESRKFFSITSRMEDQVTLNFGDGVFGEIPVGDFRAYLRKSNGLEYVISPEEIQNVDVNIGYISRTGRSETLTLTVSLMEPVSNAKGRELLSDIKRRAPAKFYTQNRMVNGEDYNLFPYTAYGSIIKSKAINRTNIGASRYLDLVDPTGKYSSINAFGSDGLIYNDESLKSFSFTFNNKNDIASVIRNKLEPMLAERSAVQFYYENFNRVDLSSTDIQWVQLTTMTNETSGYFKNTDGNALPIGQYVSDNKKYLLPHALVKFVAPEGYHFSDSNRLVLGASTLATDKDYIWATLTSVKNEGTESGTITTLGIVEGPVKLNNFVPTGAIPLTVIPLFNTDIPALLEQDMIAQIELYRDFGLGFNHLSNSWYIITSDNLNVDGDFSLVFAQSTTNTNSDASWLVKFISTPSGYQVYSRALQYYFASVIETRFFYDNSRKIFDPKTGKIVNDFVKVLRTNNKPDNTNQPLAGDVLLDVIGQTVETDGYVNDYVVEISFADNDNDGIADDPDFFSQLVKKTGSAYDSYVYLQSTVDFDNLERFVPVASSMVNADYPTKESIERVKTEHSSGQIFYAFSTNKFYELVVTDAVTRSVVERTDYVAKTGRDGLYFQYRHNSPETRRINPSTTNIIDIYVVTSSYYEAYTRFIQDPTDTVEEPEAPSTDALTVQYAGLQTKKMTSDSIVLNSVKFKPLFGAKAVENLQAYIKIVKLVNANASDSEIKSRVISTINQYFNIENWDFGDTFYFSELSAYLHSQLGDVVGSVVIVPKDPSKTFGNLYEIKSAPYEIFTSAATVDDVDIIDALTASKLQNRAG